MTDTYSYEDDSKFKRAPLLFLNIISIEQFIYSSFNIKNSGLSKGQERGVIIFCVLHYFIFWFFISAVKTIIYNAGDVPEVNY